MTQHWTEQLDEHDPHDRVLLAALAIVESHSSREALANCTELVAAWDAYEEVLNRDVEGIRERLAQREHEVVGWRAAGTDPIALGC